MVLALDVGWFCREDNVEVERQVWGPEIKVCVLIKLNMLNQRNI